MSEWQRWRASRQAEARSAHGWLAVTGTHWVESEGRLPGVPGVWRPRQGGVELKAIPLDGLTVNGRPVDGTIALSPETKRIAYGPVELVIIVRDGTAAVRIYDPAAPALAAFKGIDAFGYDPVWVRPACFRPYEHGRHEQVANADGRTRELSLVGDVTVDLPGGAHTLAVSRSGDGLTAQFGDLTNGASTYGFRTLALPLPGPAGALTADFNRAYLPPCAFAAHFLCPLPPVGNRLPVAVEAGEKSVLFR
ncbi:DUF1684 domain-containing protein [Streptosporangiaceae bacterium NEAU-GS5]|nr:DUF1684 domain-containing protein [Streptosporangiaceae bacterium NEAU-GS5]